MDQASPYPRVLRAGDSAWLVDFGERTDDEVNNAAIAFDARVRETALAGVLETAPTIRSVLVRFDALAVESEELRAALNSVLAERDWLAAAPPEGRTRWHVPVCYGGVHGPHLSAIAAACGMSEGELVRDHGATPQRVRMVGFAPGFVYTGTLSELWDLPRRTEVVAAVPPGTVAVAVRQTVLTSTTIPTGWHLIGRSPWRAFDLDRDPPFVLTAGDELVFEAIDEAAYARLEAEAHGGCNVARAEPLP